MIRVATLSFQHAYNYGAVFQVAALQHIITQLGADCDIIDYRCPAIDRQYDFKPMRLNANLINAIRANLVLAPFIRGKKKNFQHWMNSYKKSEVIADKEELKALNDRYDKFVVGSDQIWNLKCQGHDDAFFLNFVDDNTKKIAYAASFGSFDVKPEDQEFYTRYIKDFEHISVREKRGIELVKDLSGKASIACMDPVLLAGKDFWESKKDKQFQQKEKYIFVYQLGHGSILPKFVKRLQKDSGYKVYFATGHLGNIVYYSLGDKNVSTASPEKFLSLLSGAEYVVTNSFHATVLSIIFQRQFFTISKGGESSSYNNRIHNLLTDYGLKNRIMCEYRQIVDISREKYNEVEKKRVSLCELSISYLKKSIGLV